MTTQTAEQARWDEILKAKHRYLRMAAEHAMAARKTTGAEPIDLPVFAGAQASKTVTVTAKSADSITVSMQAAPRSGRPATEWIRMTLAEPIDMVTRHSGLAVTARTADGTSPEVRMGVRMIGADEEAVILPIIPAVSRWGDNPHELYFDWSSINYRDASEAAAVLRSVKAIEITAASMLRAPTRGPSAAPRPATVTLSGLRLVDYRKGEFDDSRSGRRRRSRGPDFTLQHRVQEVTGLVARFGGEAGLRAAADSLDMAARTQCWDGSFLDGRRGARTVATGEYTFGFTLYGLLCGYQTLEEIGSPLLDETVAVGGVEMTRREACQRMFYRGAMARTAALPSQYRDDIIGGDTLMTGANRVLGYAIAMRMIADVLTDKDKAAEVLAAYKPTMQQIADAQGKYSGGFPVLGEGDRYRGRGIHYDGGYIRTHMDWLVVGVIRTGDPLLVQMLRKYQTVFEAAMNSEGLGIKKLISERHPGGGDVRLILPHATYQVGVKHNLPIIAQWGYNVGEVQWDDTPANHFTSASHARGYSLGAHMSILYDDLAAEPIPADPGYLFPRQYPIWSARLYTKDGKPTRTSRVTIAPDGSTTNDFKIEVGEYPVTVGVPVKVRSGAAVVAEAVRLSGWPKLLKADAKITLSGDVRAEGRIGEPLTLTLAGPTRIVITGAKVRLPKIAGGAEAPFAAELILEPTKAGQNAELTVLRGVR